MTGPVWLLAGSLDGTGATAHRPGCPHAAGARPWNQVADLDEAQRREFMTRHGAVTACPACLPETKPAVNADPRRSAAIDAALAHASISGWANERFGASVGFEPGRVTDHDIAAADSHLETLGWWVAERRYGARRTPAGARTVTGITVAPAAKPAGRNTKGGTTQP